jgi:cysteine desulfurase
MTEGFGNPGSTHKMGRDAKAVLDDSRAKLAKALGADLISVSGHKIHAPKGIGALYLSGGARALNLPPLIVGGGQETGKRAGTEALPQIAAFGTAAALGAAQLGGSAKRMAELKALAVKRLTGEIDELKVLSGNAPHILSVSLPGFRSQVIMNFLDALGICVSNSSACKKGARSYVLEAIGHPATVTDGALRISLSRYTTEAEIHALCDGLGSAFRTLYPILR